MVCAATAASLVGCGSDGSGGGNGSSPGSGSPPGSAVIDPGDGGDYHPALAATDAVDVIDNTYLPLRTGSMWRYEGDGENGHEVTEIVVTADRKMIMGISAVVVHDTVTVDGEVLEDTYDWYTQDRDGNVWYLGEATQEFEDGKVVSTEGSWEAGVDGALPGIVMPASPTVGAAFRQEFYASHAEDLMKITGMGSALAVTAGSYSDVVTTNEWTPLQPETIEEKSYAPGVGMVRETVISGGTGTTELVAFTPGG
jgi:hypothetical protein